MFFLRKLLMVIAFFAGVVHAAPDAKPIHTVTRSFPAAGTVHCANFFYQQVSPQDVLPATEKSIVLAEEALTVFVTPQNHASVTAQSAVAGIEQLVSHVSQTIQKVENGQSHATASVKFEFSTSEKAVVVVFDVTKKGSKITADVTTFGRTVQMSQALLSALETVICDDSLLSKHWGKGLLVGLGLGSKIAWNNRRSWPIIGAMFLPFHERVVEKINRLNPGLFEEFKPFVCAGTKWAKCTTDHRYAVIVVGKDDHIVGLEQSLKDGSIGTRLNSDLCGVEFFWVIKEGGMDAKPLENFIEALNKAGFSFPHKIDLAETSSMKVPLAEDFVSATVFTKELETKRKSEVDSSQVEDFEQQFAEKVQRSLSARGWRYGARGRYSKSLAQIWIRFGDHNYRPNEVGSLLSQVSIHLVEDAGAVSDELRKATSSKERRFTRAWRLFNCVDKAFVLYRSKNSMLQGLGCTLLMNGKELPYDFLVDPIVTEILRIAEQTSVVKITAHDSTGTPSGLVPPPRGSVSAEERRAAAEVRAREEEIARSKDAEKKHQAEEEERRKACEKESKGFEDQTAKAGVLVEPSGAVAPPERSPGRPKAFEEVLSSAEQCAASQGKLDALQEDARAKLKEFMTRIKTSQDKEAEALRAFIVEPNQSEDPWEQAAYLISQMSSLSVNNFQRCEAEGLRLLKRLPTTSRKEDVLGELSTLSSVLKGHIISELPKDARCLADNTGCIVFSCSVPSRHKFILKVQNPYAYAFDRYFRQHGHEGKKCNGSTRRHARRVLAANFVNREFKDVGFHAPVKKLCLRQGAAKDGLIDDRFVIVIEEFLEKSALSKSLPLTDEQLRARARVMSFAGTSDLHEQDGRENVLRTKAPEGSGRECDITFLDLESPFYRGKYTYGDALFDVGPACYAEGNRYFERRRVLNLTRKVCLSELHDYLFDRVSTVCDPDEIEKLVKEEDAQIKNFRRICIQRQNLRLYLKELVKKGFLNTEQSAQVQYFWMGDDIDYGFLSLDDEHKRRARREYLAGNAAADGWKRPFYKKGDALRAYEQDVFLPEQAELAGVATGAGEC